MAVFLPRENNKLSKQAMPGNPLVGKVEVFGETQTSIVYCQTGEDTVLKAPELWLDGKGYARRPLEGSLEKEDAIYKLLKDHPRIVRSFGLETIAPGVTALRLERATVGCLRLYILNHRDDPPPIPLRLRMAREFAEGMAHLHSKGVLWHDVSPRNALLFDGMHVKLCDFGASFAGEGDDVGPMNDTRCTVPRRGRREEDIPVMVCELFALGSAVFEILEWRVPYDGVEDVEIGWMVYRGELPVVSEWGRASCREE